MHSTTVLIWCMAAAVVLSVAAIPILMNSHRSMLERVRRDADASAAAERKAWHDRLQKIQELADEEKNRYRAAAQNVPQRYIMIQPFDDTQRNFLRTMTDIERSPEFRFTLYDLSMKAYGKLTSDGVKGEDKLRWANYMEAYDTLLDRLIHYRRAYDTLTTEREPEEDNAEVSLS